MRGVELMLFHPGPAAVACAECQTYVLRTDEHGRVLPERLRHGGRDWLRPPNVPPPCHRCPKESPQAAREHELSRKNALTLALYFQVRATRGACLAGGARQDPLLAANLALVEAVVERWERAARYQTP